jgi:hypothetical protein
LPTAHGAISISVGSKHFPLLLCGEMRRPSLRSCFLGELGEIDAVTRQMSSRRCNVKSRRENILLTLASPQLERLGNHRQVTPLPFSSASVHRPA